MQATIGTVIRLITASDHGPTCNRASHFLDVFLRFAFCLVSVAPVCLFVVFLCLSFFGFAQCFCGFAHFGYCLDSVVLRVVDVLKCVVSSCLCAPFLCWAPMTSFVFQIYSFQFSL